MELRHTLIALGLISSLGATSPAASSPLFAQLKLTDFPSAAHSVQWVPRELAPGRATMDVYRTRTVDVGYASRWQVSRAVDRLTRRRTLSISRQDDACTAEAQALNVPPAQHCLSVRIQEEAAGVARVSLRAPEFNFDLNFRLVRRAHATEGAKLSERWALLETGRVGEPTELSLISTHDAKRGLLAQWKASGASAAGNIEFNVRGAVPERKLAAAGFTPFELNMMSSVELLYDLAESYRPWALRNFGEIVDTETPGPGGFEDGQCELMPGVCGAEHDTCIPTPDGWYGCDYGPGFPPDWGHGHGDDTGPGPGPGPGPNPPPPPPPPQTPPDWRVGSFATTPIFPSPLFIGMTTFTDANGDLRLGAIYQITSVLQKASATPQNFPPGVNATPGPKAHVVFVRLVPDGGDASQALCGFAHFSDRTAVVPKGDAVTYREDASQPGSETLVCNAGLDPGIYIMRYELDPFDMWDEGSAGEGNNEGAFRGLFIKR
jgi:hypothetical protein